MKKLVLLLLFCMVMLFEGGVKRIMGALNYEKCSACQPLSISKLFESYWVIGNCLSSKLLIVAIHVLVL